VHTFRRENWGRMSALRLGGKGQALLGGAGDRGAVIEVGFDSGFDLSFCKAARPRYLGVGLRVKDFVASLAGTATSGMGRGR
jgi:hypothetical protein